jgi:hypothetical protein
MKTQPQYTEHIRQMTDTEQQLTFEQRKKSMPVHSYLIREGITIGDLIVKQMKDVHEISTEREPYIRVDKHRRYCDNLVSLVHSKPMSVPVSPSKLNRNSDESAGE